MTLKLAIEITADAAGARKGAAESKAALGEIGGAAREAAREASAALQVVTDGAGKSAEALRREEQAARGASAALRQLSAEEVSLAQARRAANDASLNSAGAIDGRLGVRSDFDGHGRAADIAAYGQALDDLRARYSPLYAVQRTYVAQLKEIREAERLGALSAKEAAEAIDRTKASFAAAVPVLRGKPAGGAGQSIWSQMRPDQRQNLMYQANDVFTSVTSGMPLQMVAAQQGPQIVQALGGVRPALAAVAGLLTPVAVGVGGITAALGLGASAWYSYTSATKAAATAATSFGRAAGVTASDIERAAQLNAAAAGLSVSQARDVAVELTRTGRIGSAQFGGLIGVAKDFAATMQTDVATGSQQLAKLFADPSAGADQLQQMQLLDGATARLVKSYAEAGDEERARAQMLEGLSRNLAKAGDATTWLGRRWDELMRGLSDGGNALGRELAGGEIALERQLETVRAKIRGQEASPAQFGLDRLRQEAAELERRISEREREVAARTAAAQKAQAGSVAVATAQGSPANEELRQRIQLEAQLQRLEAGRDAPGLTAQEQTQVAQAIEATRHALDGLAGARARQVEIERLDLKIQAERDPAARADLVAQRERLSLQGQLITQSDEASRVERARQKATEESAAAAKLAARTISEGQADQIETARLELSLIGATNVERGRALALLQAEQQIRQAQIPSTSAEADKIRADAATAATLTAQATAAQAARAQWEAGRDQNEQLRAEAGLIGATNAQRTRTLALLQAEQQIRAQQIDPASTQAAELRTQALRNADLTSRVAAAQAARQQWETGRDQLEQLDLEASLLGASTTARARAVALLQTEQTIRRAGIEAGSAEAEMLREQTTRIVEQTSALERRQGAWSAYTSAGESALDKLGDAIAEHKTSWSDWRDVIDEVATDINKTLVKLAITNPLKNLVFGTNYGTLGDMGGTNAGGGLLGQLTRGITGAATPGGAAAGGAAGIGAALASGAGVVNLTANVVNVTGGVAGLGAGAWSAGGAAGGGWSSGGLASLASARSRYDGELADPAVLDKLYAMTHAEAGGQGAQAQQAVMETFFNRASARGMSLDDVLSQRSYFPQSTFDSAAGVMGSPQLQAQYAPLLAQVRGGSNISAFATGNASGSVGFGGGPMTAAFGGEKFGIERADAGWAAQMQQFSGSLGDATQATTQFGSGLTDVASSASNALSGAGAAAQQAGSESLQLAAGAEQASSATGDFASGIGDALQQLMSSIGDALSGVGKGISGALSGLAGGGTSLFAAGGIMTSAGPVPLRAYAKGGIARSPQLALYGEGAQPEAYVPLPDGRRIPVNMRMPDAYKQAGASVSAVTTSISVAPVYNIPDGAGRDRAGDDRLQQMLAQQTAQLERIVRDVVRSDLRGNGPMSGDIAARFGLNAMRGAS